MNGKALRGEGRNYDPALSADIRYHGQGNY